MKIKPAHLLWTLAWTLTGCVAKEAAFTFEIDGAMASPTSSDEGCFGADRQASGAAPRVCHSAHGTFVVGLPAGHGWSRNERLFITRSDDISSEHTIAVAWVLQTFPDAAKISVMYQLPSTPLIGASARLVRSDEQIRFEKYYVVGEPMKDGSFRLDRGKADQVDEGDVYEAREREHPDVVAGRVRVTSVTAGHAYAEIVEELHPRAQWKEFVFSGGKDTREGGRTGIAVLPTRIADPQDPGQQSKRLQAQKVLAGLEKRIEETLPATEIRPVLEQIGETDERAAARHAVQAARRNGANIAVWAEIRCKDRGCLSLKLARVPDSAEDEPVVETIAVDTSSVFSLRGTIGQVAAIAGRYEESSYYLRSSPELERSAEQFVRLVGVDLKLGQIDRAYSSALAANRAARTPEEREHSARALAKVSCEFGELEEKIGWRERLQRIPFSEVQRVLADVTLCISEEYLQRGEVLQAQQEIERWSKRTDLALASKAHFTMQSGKIALYLGQAQTARNQFRLTLNQSLAAGDAALAAASLLGLAQAQFHLRSLNEARVDALKALQWFQTHGDLAGIADCLQVLVQITTAREGVAAARRFLEGEKRRSAGRGIGRERVRLVYTRIQAYLDIQQGKLGAASRELAAMIKQGRQLKILDAELTGLRMLAEVQLLRGEMQAAHANSRALSQRARELENPVYRAHSELLDAQLNLMNGQAKEASSGAEQAVRRFRSVREPSGQAAAMLVQAEAAKELGESERARVAFEGARLLYQKAQDRSGVDRAALGLAVLELESGRTGEATQRIGEIAGRVRQTGNAADLLAVDIYAAWASFVRARDGERAVQELRRLTQQAGKQSYLRLRADGLRYLACVHRATYNNAAGNSAWEAAERAYKKIGRYQQRLTCSPELYAPAMSMVTR